MRRYPHLRRTGLIVPALQQRQIYPAGILHRPDEIFGTHRLPVVARKVEVHPAPKVRRTEQRVDQTDDLRAFFVNGGGVEIANFHIGVGAHRMCHRAGVFRELAVAQSAHFPNALYGVRVTVAAVLLVAKNREPFFKTELKPVTASHAIARPVMKIFVGDHPV